jgi:hypothetical protein
MNKRNALPVRNRRNRMGRDVHPELPPTVNATRNDAKATESVTPTPESNFSPTRKVRFSLSFIKPKVTTIIPIGTFT